MKFEIGKRYEALDNSFGSIEILNRTDKTVFVTNGMSKWRMRIRVDKDGTEYVIDSSAGKKWKEAFTYTAKWEERQS